MYHLSSALVHDLEQELVQLKAASNDVVRLLIATRVELRRLESMLERIDGQRGHVEGLLKAVAGYQPEAASPTP
jgi:hypothetical protein